LILLAIAIVGKVLGCGIGAYATGFSRRDSLAVGVGMIPRGEVGLITASLGLTAGLVTQDVYVQSVALVLVTTLVTPALLRFCFSKTETATDVPGALDRLPVPAGASELSDA